jgi:release factor glutamine methyltransferase
MQRTPPEAASLRLLLKEAEAALAAGPHPEKAKLDAEALLLYILRRTDPERNRAWLITHGDDAAPDAERLRELVQRRLTGEPIQYITGETEFYGLPFRVTPAVLIPRPETEHLVEQALALAAAYGAPRILDIGTGSGAIPVALAAHLPQAQITAVDISPAAIELAGRNAALNGVEHRIRFLKSDLLGAVRGEQFDLILSNPPYVPEGDRPSLSVEVRDHEPSLALFAGRDGLDIYRRLIPEAFAALAQGGSVALEIGFGQSEAIASLLSSAGFEHITFTPDLQGIARVASARRP